MLGQVRRAPSPLAGNRGAGVPARAGPRAVMEQLRPLRELVQRWVEGSSDLLRISAYSRDVDALLELTPPRRTAAREKGGVAVAGLFDTAQELYHFLRRQLRPALRPRAGAAPVCSPYAGAVPQSVPGP